MYYRYDEGGCKTVCLPNTYKAVAYSLPTHTLISDHQIEKSEKFERKYKVKSTDKSNIPDFERDH